MQNTIELKSLSRKEKMQIMETIWQDLSIEEEEIISPDWHQEELRQTAARLRMGQESIIDWNVGKKQLREQFE